MKVAVLGAGHGGQAMTADLTLAGHEVRFAAVPEHSTNIRLLQAFGGIVLEGVTSSGKAPGFSCTCGCGNDRQGAGTGDDLEQGDGGKKAAVVLDFHDRIGLRPGAAPWREAAGGDGRPDR